MENGENIEKVNPLKSLLALSFSLGTSDIFNLHSVNKTVTNTSIFTDDDLFILEKNKKTEPDWTYMFFEWMSDSMKQIYFEILNEIYNQPNLYFIKGLLSEYNYSYNIPENTSIKITDSDSNISFTDKYKKALEYYLLGAKTNNQYCFYKLFYILKDKSCAEKFGLQKDIDLSLFYLIKASSYNESFLDINKIDPIIKLMHIVYFKDRELNRIRKLLEKMKYVNNELNILIDDVEFKYLYNFIRLNFSNRDYEFKDALFNLESICDSHPEACYKLACLYYNPIHKDICKKNVEKSILFFTNLYNKNYVKSYCSYYKICEELKLFDSIEDILKKCKLLKSYSSQFYANYLSRNKEDLFINSEKILKYFFNSLLYGNIISIVICFEIISQIFIKNLCENKNKSITKKYLKAIYDYVSNKKNDINLFKIIDYDILILFHQIHAYFYYKGILQKKNIHKSIEILENTFEDKKSIKNYRKVFYYLGKAYKKIGNFEKSNIYLKYAFDIYIMLKEFPYHHYVVAKIFLRGIPGVIDINIPNAFHFFNLGANYKENYYFINSFYSKKCLSYLQENKEIINFSSTIELICGTPFSGIDSYIKEDNICIVCYSNFKQIIFVKCGHKCICYLCFEKINKPEGNLLKSNGNWKCPMCQQESDNYINSFELDK